MNGLAVAIFAHDEADSIAEAIGCAIDAAGAAGPLRVHVLANGCTDDTVPIVRRLARADPRIVLHEIAMPDKCNAWNVYVHEVADEADVHCFMDGDMRLSEQAVERAAQALLARPDANALGGVPLSGRNREYYIRLMHDYGWLYGCFYALRGGHVARLRATGVRLPVGLFGDDHFVSRIARSSLDGDWDECRSRLLIVPTIGYVFDSLRPWSPRDLRLYLRRRVSYFLRQRQLDVLDTEPLRQLPRTTRALDSALLERLRTDPVFRWNPVRRPAIRRLEARLARGYGDA